MNRSAGTAPKPKTGRAPVWLSTRDRVIVLPLVPLGVLLVGLGLVLLHKVRPEWVDAGRMYVVDRLAPVLHGVMVPVDATVQAIDSAADLWRVHEENQRLRAENAQLRQWQQVALRLEMENRAVGAVAGYHSQQDQTVALARVIVDQTAFFSRSVLMAAGADQGVVKNQPAVDDRGVVGRVQEVGKQSARIVLLTDSTSQIPVIVERTGLQAIARGTNQHDLELDFADHHMIVHVGDRVLTSGTGGVFPPGLLLGVVSTIDATGPKITPAAALGQLMMVRILQTADIAEPRFDPPLSLSDQEAPESTEATESPVSETLDEPAVKTTEEGGIVPKPPALPNQRRQDPPLGAVHGNP